jgi:N-acetylmuramoyl-L-alanine amidase
MLKNKKTKKILILGLVFGMFISYHVFFRNDEILALSKYGSQGSEVTQIQTKLKRWGYYNGNIDGIYGSQTLAAVKWFQSKNGLTVDGIAGKNTLEAMGIYTSSTTSSGTSNTSDLNLLSRLIYGESRGEPYAGQVAVGAVVLNRVRSSSFPNSIAGVIYQTRSF